MGRNRFGLLYTLYVQLTGLGWVEDRVYWMLWSAFRVMGIPGTECPYRD